MAAYSVVSKTDSAERGNYFIQGFDAYLSAQGYGRINPAVYGNPLYPASLKVDL